MDALLGNVIPRISRSLTFAGISSSASRMQDEAGKRSNQLVDAKGLLSILFEESCRPSLRWLRTLQYQRVIPHVVLGRRIFFDVDAVRSVLAQRWTVKSRQ